jgi:hypothetical protein
MKIIIHFYLLLQDLYLFLYESGFYPTIILGKKYFRFSVYYLLIE